MNLPSKFLWFDCPSSLPRAALLINGTSFMPPIPPLDAICLIQPDDSASYDHLTDH